MLWEGGRVRKEATEAPRRDSSLPRLCQVNLDFVFSLKTKLSPFNLTHTTPVMAQNRLLLKICVTIFSAAQLF